MRNTQDQNSFIRYDRINYPVVANPKFSQTGKFSFQDRVLIRIVS